MHEVFFFVSIPVTSLYEEVELDILARFLTNTDVNPIISASSYISL